MFGDCSRVLVGRDLTVINLIGKLLGDFDVIFLLRGGLEGVLFSLIVRLDKRLYL